TRTAMGQGDGRDDEAPDEHPEGFDEDPEDEHAGTRGPLPDPLDRLWLHPTELSILGGGVEPAGGARHRTLPCLAPGLAGAADVPAAQLADGAPSTGSAVWLLGAPAARTTAPWMSAGMASSNDALVVSDLGPATGGLLETYAASTAAVVGGALVDASGSVAGIVLGHVNGSATSYAVPINVAAAVARQLDATGVAQHGTVGV